MRIFRTLVPRAIVLALVLALSLSGAVLAADNPLGASPAPDHLTLTWSADPATTQTITWRTDTSVNQTVVQYTEAGRSFPAKSRTAEGTVDKLSSNLGEMNIHTVTLTGLKPGTQYTYRVGDGSRWSEPHMFTTEAQNVNSFQFLIFGDSQSGSVNNPEYGPWQKTVHSAFQANPDAKFIINVGDLVEAGQSYVHWNNWFNAAQGVIDAIPEMPTQGNHETYNPPDMHSTRPVNFVAQFKVPQNGPDALKGQVYSFDYGDAHFVMLDSQQAEEGKVIGDVLNMQKQWLANDLAKTDKKWKLVFFHKTPYYNKATRSNEILKETFLPIIDQYHADVVFNGHDHNVARTYPLFADHFVDSAAKGTVYYVTGRGGNKYYPDLSAKVWDAFFYDPQDQPNYIVANVNGDKLTLTARKQDGTVIDTYTIDKSTGTTTPATVTPPRYNNTRLVIYGNMLQEPLMPVPPRQINGKWYVPLRPFIEFLGGNIVWQGNGAIDFTCGKDNGTVNVDSTTATAAGQNVAMPDKVLLDKGVTLISADDLTKLLGFAYKYDSSTNMLLFTR